MKVSTRSKMWQYFLDLLSFWRVLYPSRSVPPGWLLIGRRLQMSRSVPTPFQASKCQECLKLQGLGKTHDTFVDLNDFCLCFSNLYQNFVVLFGDSRRRRNWAEEPCCCHWMQLHLRLPGVQGWDMLPSVGMICKWQIHKTAGSSLQSDD